MVSRQETARPLLTPGEVMQLPPSDEIAMVAGTPPIRAIKARYFEDGRFMERIQTPPDLVANPVAPKPSSDDWSCRVTGPPGCSTTAAAGAEGDPANAGIRSEPELPEHEEIVAPPPSPAQEFDILDDEPDVDAASRAIIDLVAARGGVAHIPTQSRVKVQRSVAPTLYRRRNLVERYFCKLKQFRRIATRFDKRARNFLAAVALASTRIWLRAIESTP